MTHIKSLLLILLLLLTMLAVGFKHGVFNEGPVFRDIETYNPEKIEIFEEPVDAGFASLAEYLPASDEVKMLFLGDMMMGRHVRTLIDRHGKDFPFEKLPEDFFKGYDLVIANLEGPITERFITGGLSLVFGFPPDTAEILKNKGINVVTLGNNHTMNRGEEGYQETLEYLDAQGVEYFGHQDYEDAATSLLSKEINGLKFTFISLHDAERRIDREVALELIRTAEPNSHYVVVLPHWGLEYQHRANQRQKDLAHEWIDAGADLIIGHHPHVVQNKEIYKDRAIFYSLGNFVFDQYFSVAVQEELALAVTFKEKSINFELIPMKSKRSQSSIMDEKAKKLFLTKFLKWGDESLNKQDILNKGSFILSSF